MRQLKTMNPLDIPIPLGKNPSSQAKYPISIKNSQKKEVILADPRATRAALLLMNQHAVIGGAACHWGGPAAFAEIMSALYGLMFEKNPWFDFFNFVND
ncbi:MAG: transketolase, partial [Halobacteriovoraceae bacterium]|nr:transketolase [Halobacteriovoraceae bacterium]